MLNIPSSCPRLGRRHFLRLGALGVGGLTLADILRSEAQPGPAPPGTTAPRAETAPRGKSLIYVVLSGGPSHIDMYDLKPDAPAEFRGPFQPIATSLPGAEISELMPRQAEIMDRCALVRGIRSVENDHFLSEVYTGLPRTAGRRPAFGSIASRLLPRDGVLPPYVNVHRREEGAAAMFDYEQPHYAGAAHAPFRPFDDALEDLSPVKSLERLDDRRALLKSFDALRRASEHLAEYHALDQFQREALSVIASSAVRDAFDLSREPAGTLERYGHHQGKYTHQVVKTILYPWEAKSFVLARRLVEAGVRVVTITIGNWDHHSGPDADIFCSLGHMAPCLDRSLHALITDLHERGLDNDVAVIVLGEFGRTPKIVYPGPGREHWAEAGCALFYGGGLKMGQVIGATDRRAERSVDGAIGFQNILATIYRVLGIDPATALADFNGRPQFLLDDARPIRELVG